MITSRNPVFPFKTMVVDFDNLTRDNLIGARVIVSICRLIDKQNNTKYSLNQRFTDVLYHSPFPQKQTYCHRHFHSRLKTELDLIAKSIFR